MRVLLTNDDGISSKGLEALRDGLATAHEVTVVAPEAEQSAVGHAITFLDPLRVKSIQRDDVFYGYAVSGTPADCVKLAVLELMQPPPDVVVSGINLGANLGHNILYSGTVSAATEGALLGIPGIAVSMEWLEYLHFESAVPIVLKLLKIMEKEKLPSGVSLNVNVPNRPLAQIKGVRVTRQGALGLKEMYDRRVDPRNRAYYWLHAVRTEMDPAEDWDVRAIDDGYISITPIRTDMTYHRIMDQIRAWGLEEE